MPRLHLLLLLTASLACAADWARFRGPNGSGVAADAKNVPAEFGPAKNVVWKTAVPFGRSSPVIAGGRIFLTATEGYSLVTLAYDAATGRELWRRAVPRARSEKHYKANGTASPTPAADASGVYVFFSDFGLIAYTHAGEERWRLPLGPVRNYYGVSSSPVLAGGLLIQLVDQSKGSFLLAVDPATGKQRWRAERTDAMEGWGIPIAHEDQLIAVGTNRVYSYHLATGEPRWSYPLPSAGSMGSPVIHGDTVIVTASGFSQPWLPPFAAPVAKLDKDGDGQLSAAESKNEQDWAEHFPGLDADGNGRIDQREWDQMRALGIGEFGAVALPLASRGKLDASAARWRFKRNLPYVPAPVLYNGIFYMVKDGGIVTALDPATGALHKQGRADKAPGQYLASPVAADGKIYLASEEGKVTVLKATADWAVLAVNDLGEECYATPAIVGDRLVMRTRSALYAFSSGPDGKTKK
ncbi:MAG: PQQ-binding-like beta-propeller repeat protein [Bryobacterales bacterium]|nr:PQQ-binding-like beta-propeller repeat protein [Bryobacterales bacterium]